MTVEIAQTGVHALTMEPEEEFFGPLDENGLPYYNEKTKAILTEKAERMQKIIGSQRQPAS